MIALTEDDFVFYEADYVNAVVWAESEAGESLVLVAGTHSQHFPYFGDDPWDNALLVVGEKRYEQTVRMPGLVRFDLNLELEHGSSPAVIQISGPIRDVSAGMSVDVDLIIKGPAVGFQAHQEGRLFDGLPGMRWHPFVLSEATAEVQIGGSGRRFHMATGQMEHGKLKNIKSPMFAFFYDYVSVINSPSKPFQYVAFETHALDESLIGKIFDAFLVQTASEELTYESGKEFEGNTHDVVRPDKSDASVVVAENVVTLKLANLHRQLIRTKDGAGQAMFGMREIFERL